MRVSRDPTKRAATCRNGRAAGAENPAAPATRLRTRRAEHHGSRADERAGPASCRQTGKSAGRTAGEPRAKPFVERRGDFLAIERATIAMFSQSRRCQKKSGRPGLRSSRNARRRSSRISACGSRLDGLRQAGGRSRRVGSGHVAPGGGFMASKCGSASRIFSAWRIESRRTPTIRSPAEREAARFRGRRHPRSAADGFHTAVRAAASAARTLGELAQRGAVARHAYRFRAPREHDAADGDARGDAEQEREGELGERGGDMARACLRDGPASRGCTRGSCARRPCAR